MGHKSSICFESGLFSVVYNISFVFFSLLENVWELRSLEFSNGILSVSFRS